VSRTMGARHQRASLWLPLTTVATLLAGCDQTTNAQETIPADYRTLYQTAPLCAGLDWATLAAVGKIETDHGRSPLPGVHSGTNSAGAAGPMQFLAPTWRAVRKRHPDVGPDIYNPQAAITAAAHKLCDDGAATGGTRKALFAYNHSQKYVTQVLVQASGYRP